MEFGVGVRRYAPPSGPLPINAGPLPSNTRGVITAGCNDAGHLRHLVVERYFEQPFINDYALLNKDTGTVTVPDNESKAQIAVKLSGRTLALTSKNPHSRISTAYRLYSRRETSLTSAIASWVQ